MALPIDDLIFKALDTANLATLIPQVWAPNVEPNLRKAAVLQQSLTVDTTLVGEGGDRVFLPILPDLAAAAALSEEDLSVNPPGNQITIQQLSAANYVPLIPSEVGSAVGISRKALDRLKYDGMSLIVDRLAYSMSQFIEGQIAGLWNKAVPTVGGTLAQRYPNGHISTTVVAGDVMSSDVLRDSVALLQSGNMMPFDDGLYMAFLSPKQINDLMKDSKFRDDLHFAQPQTMLRGELGIYANCHIIASNYLKTATENTVTVTKGLVVGPRWAAVAYKRAPELVVDPTIYDFGRRRQVGIVADLDIELIHSDHGIVISTTTSL